MKPNSFLIEIEKIVVDNPSRLQRDIDTDGVLMELKNNIETYGMKIPLLVSEYEDGSYHLVDGYRRLQVVTLLGFEKVECIVTDKDFISEVSLSVNIHREDFTSIEIGNLLLNIYTQQKQKDASFKYSKLVPIVNKSKSYISQHIGYVEKLSMEIQQDIVDNKRMIDKNILTRIYQLDEDNQKIVYNTMIDGNLGREEVQKLIDGLSKEKSDESDGEVDDEKLSNNPTSEKKSGVIHFSNKYFEFSLRSDVIDDGELELFQQEMSELLKKYNLSEEV
jgi:ParB/RepB/Spo0J family partition protein